MRLTGALGAAMLTVSVVAALAQAPPAPPQSSQTVGISGSIALPPDGAVTFFRAPCPDLPTPAPPPTSAPPRFPTVCSAPPSTLAVRYHRTSQEAGPVTVAYDGVWLTLRASSDAHIQVQPPDDATCQPVGGASPSLVHCRVTPDFGRMQPVLFTTVSTGTPPVLQRQPRHVFPPPPTPTPPPAGVQTGPGLAPLPGVRTPSAALVTPTPPVLPAPLPR